MRASAKIHIILLVYEATNTYKSLVFCAESSTFFQKKFEEKKTVIHLEVCGKSFAEKFVLNKVQYSKKSPLFEWGSFNYLRASLS